MKRFQEVIITLASLIVVLCFLIALTSYFISIEVRTQINTVGINKIESLLNQSRANAGPRPMGLPNNINEAMGKKPVK